MPQAPDTWIGRWCQGPLTLEEAMRLSQIVITKIEEPVDKSRGIVWKVALFDSKECVDVFYCPTEADVHERLTIYLEDLNY